MSFPDWLPVWTVDSQHLSGLMTCLDRSTLSRQVTSLDWVDLSRQLISLRLSEACLDRGGVFRDACFTCHVTGPSSLARELRKCTKVSQQSYQTLRKFTVLQDSCFLNARV